MSLHLLAYDTGYLGDPGQEREEVSRCEALLFLFLESTTVCDGAW